jgi:toxin ParE1/3/4
LKIQVTKPAQQDLTDLDSYIRRDHPKVALRIVQRILEAIEGLEMFPNLGRSGRVSGTRELVVSGTPYIVVYRVRNNFIWVLRVLHGAMRWPPTR